LRNIQKAEKIYRRVRDFVSILPLDILASLRVYLSTPSCIDSLRKRIKKGIGISCIECNNWKYSFWYGEKEFDELMRQVL